MHPFVLVLSAVLVLTTAQASDDTLCIADVGFVMDLSNLITSTNLKKEQYIVKRLVELFGVRLGGSRAGLITFSTKATTLVPIGQNSTAAEFNKVVDSLDRTDLGGYTYIDRALIEATNVLFGSKYYPVHNNKYLIILTTGRQVYNPHGSNIDLKILTKPLRHLQVRIVAVGMPHHTHLTNLKKLVAENTDVVTITAGSQPSAIDVKIKKISDALGCNKAPAYVRKCLKRIDLGFALDASGSIGNRTFQKVRAFVPDLLKHFSLSTSETHAGVIVYSTEPKVVIQLNEFYDLGTFSKELSRRTPWKRRNAPKWMNGLTRIDLALTMAKNELFNQTNGDRPNVRNALIFLTDGEQKPPAPAPLDQYALPLVNDNVTIFAVGFGRANERELKKIASSPEYALAYNGSVEVLQNAVEDIVQNLCNYCPVKVNLGFVVDASKTTSNWFETGMKTLVKHVAEGFALKPGGSKATVITFGDNAFQSIPFTSDLEFFKIEVEFLRNHGGHTYINKGLLKAEEVFDKLADVGVPNILIVLTDGRQSGLNTDSINRIKLIADSLRKKHLTVFAVSTTVSVKQIYDSILRNIAGVDDNFLRWNTDILGTLGPQIVKKACPKSILATKRDEIADPIESY